MSNTKRDELIKKLTDANLELCIADSAFNDQFIYDLLTYGFKGFNHMTDEELEQERIALCVEE